MIQLVSLIAKQAKKASIDPQPQPITDYLLPATRVASPKTSPSHSNSPIRSPARLHIIAVNPRRGTGIDLPETAPVPAVEIDEFEVEGVDVAG